jgi:hypothetical protein
MNFIIRIFFSEIFSGIFLELVEWTVEESENLCQQQQI